MKRIALILILLIAGNLSAKKIRLDLDLAEFKYNDTTSFWEMYYVFPDTALTYVKSDGKYIGEMLFTVKISNDADSILNSKSWIITHQSEKPVRKFEMDLYGQKNFLIPKGKHDFKISLRDVNDSTTFAEKEFGIISRKFSNDEISVSYIQLAQNIEKRSQATQNWQNSFLKNSYYVIPNPRKEFIGEKPVLNVYSEVYNAKKIAPEGYKLVYEIKDAADIERARLEFDRKSFADAIVETESIPLESLPTGVYLLNLKVLYPLDDPEDSTETAKKFYVLNPKNPAMLETNFVESLTFETSEFAAMTAEEVEKEYNQIKYIIEDYEIDLFEATETVDAKRKFLYRFWERRDPDTTNAINKSRMEYKNRIEYANEHFSYGLMKEGWNTERGRVYLMYGEPTEIERHPVKNALRAYRVWFYAEQQGGIHFYFVDLLNTGNYVLVHSTAAGERYNEYWYDEYVDTDNLDPYRRRMHDDGR